MPNDRSNQHPTQPRAAVICGPYLSGKTSLLEAMLYEAGALNRRGSVDDGTTLGDDAKEAREHSMSTELNVATADYLDERWTFIDCPGSVELMQETINAVGVGDIAVVVTEPDPEKAVALAPLMRLLDQSEIPHLVFINKMDQTQASVRETLEALQAASSRPLVLREVPIREGDNVSGYVDLVSERAFKWEEGKPSSLIKLPDSVAEREEAARTEMLESLADFDDDLLEKLLEDAIPSTGEVYDAFSQDLAGNLIVPVFFGSATHGNGIRRLMKALRHDTPDVETTTERLGISNGQAHVRIFKTAHAGHAGKLSYGRVFTGSIADGDTLAGARPAGISKLFGPQTERIDSAGAGDVAAFGKLEEVSTGDLLTPSKNLGPRDWPDVLPPLFTLAIQAESRSDDVKLPGHIQKLTEEDPALSTDHDEATGEYVLRGQGDMHLKLAVERLKNRSGIEARTAPPRVPYCETIRKPVTKHARHKKQSGGHGEFGDVHLDVMPLGRGEGFRFEQTIHGGTVPKQYIPAVEAGVKDALQTGPLGFPVVDVAVTLTDGQYHSVDSSDMAFRKAGGQAIREALPEAGPQLLEPIHAVTISVPSQFTPRMQRIVPTRRGQILGFDTKDGWEGWDEMECLLPQAEMQDLIVEIRSATQGAGTFTSRFDHLQELSGKDAERVAELQAAAE